MSFDLTFGIVVVLVMLVAYASSRIKVATDDEALVRWGRGGMDHGMKVQRGGWMFVLPFLHSMGRVSLRTRRVVLSESDLIACKDARLAIKGGVVLYKAGDDEASIRNAFQEFHRTDVPEVDHIVASVITESLRVVVGGLTVEELDHDHEQLQDAARSAASRELRSVGLVIDRFTFRALEFLPAEE